jgi:hypothetical protein
LANHSVRPDRDLSRGGQERIYDPSLPPAESPEEALSDRRIFQKVIVLLVRFDERLNLTLKRGIALNRARNEPSALILGAFGRFMK